MLCQSLDRERREPLRREIAQSQLALRRLQLELVLAGVGAYRRPLQGAEPQRVERRGDGLLCAGGRDRPGGPTTRGDTGAKPGGTYRAADDTGENHGRSAPRKNGTSSFRRRAMNCSK